VNRPFVAYIFDGQLHLEVDGKSQILESAFGRSLRDRAIQIYNRNAWKQQGRGGQSVSRALRTPAERDPSEFRIAITSVTRGTGAGELLYTLETDEISGVFSRDADGLEKRIFHTADFRTRHLDAHPDGLEVAVSIYHRNGTANLAVLKTDGTDLTELTDGDSVDAAPRWVPGPKRRLVFQSAGAARGPQGRFSGFGPSGIQQLDIETGELSCLAQDANFDFLWPRIAADGTLFYIRKPADQGPQPVNPWLALSRAALLPLQFLVAIAALLELFIKRQAGQPLVTPKNFPEKTVKTPSSWALMRQSPGAEAPETLATNARSFDVGSDGSLVYSDGIDVYRMSPNGGPVTKILSGATVELLSAF
jgi:hypothetical protein